MLLTAIGLLRTNSGSPTQVPAFGVYAGPGQSGVTNAAAFAERTGAPVTHVLDFASAKDWTSISGPSWLLDPHAAAQARLEYSLPMMPDSGHHTLSSCASGAYDVHWQVLAVNLINAGLPDTIIRPGWEFNGNWYPWSAAGHASDYAGCFRKIVTTMRAVKGARFSFDWNPTLGNASMAAEDAYPGDAYVDYVGVDAYDTSPRYARDKTASDHARVQAAAWNDDLHGDHGLLFWSRFAAAHHKPIAIPEWGVVEGAGGQGGGDDPAYIGHMFRFMTDSRHHVAYEQYFDSGSSFAEHRLGPGTHFPRSQAEFRHWVRALTT